MDFVGVDRLSHRLLFSDARSGRTQNLFCSITTSHSRTEISCI